MRNLSGIATNLLTMTLVTYILIILQSSFRPLSDLTYFSWIPSTMNWLPVIVYLSLYRKPLEGILSIYFILLSITVLTVSTTGLLWMMGLSIFLCCQIVKSRLFWNGSQYFCLLCFISVFATQITNFLANLIFLDFYSFPQIFLWIPQAFLTLVPAWFCFYLLKWVDAITSKESLTEVAGGELL